MLQETRVREAAEEANDQFVPKLYLIRIVFGLCPFTGSCATCKNFYFVSCLLSSRRFQMFVNNFFLENLAFGICYQLSRGLELAL